MDIAKCVLIVRPSNNSVSTVTSILYSEDGVSNSFQNAGIYLRRYTASNAGKTPFKKRDVPADLHNMSTALSKQPLYFPQALFQDCQK